MSSKQIAEKCSYTGIVAFAGFQVGYFSENEKVLPGFSANGSAFSLFFEESRDMAGLSGLFSNMGFAGTGYL
jgi:hypothetical protein